MLAEQLISPEIQTPPYQILDLDTQFEIQLIHSYYLNQAKDILSSNLQNAENNDPSIANSVPLPINVLSVSDRIVKEKNDSVNAFSLREALHLDSRRTVAEVTTRFSPVYFPSNFQYYDPDKNDLFNGPRSLTKISENGLSPYCRPEEQQIRILDYVDNMLNIELVKRCQKEGSSLTLLRVKRCPDYVIDDYEQSNDENDTYYGYVPQVKKFVLERDRISPEGVVSDHFALPGTLIDSEIIGEALNMLTNQEVYQGLSGLELRAKSFVIPDDDMAFIEFVKLLDDLAQEKHAQNVFMGEVVSEESSKDYLKFIDQCQVQDQQNEDLAKEVSEFLLNESRKKSDPIISEIRLNQFLAKRSFELFRRDTPKIGRTFGVQVAINLEVINYQYQTTKDQIAYDGAIKTLSETLPPVTFCGAGSCNLKAVPKGSALDKQLEKKGLRGEKLQNNEKATTLCPKCKSNKVYYDFNGSKLCGTCGNSDIKRIFFRNIKK